MDKQRIGRVIENMRREGLTQIIVSSTASIFYLTGLWMDPHERLLALYLDDSGKTVLFGNEIFGFEAVPDLTIISHKDTDEPLRGMSEVLKPGKLGIDKFWSSKFLIGLMELRRDIIPVIGSGPVDMARRIKDEGEIMLMRYNSQINDEVIGAVIDMIGEGVTENNLASEVNRLFLKNGADCEGPQIVCFGANCADPHHSPDNTIIKRGDSVILDIYSPIHRYWCDMTRTVFFRKPSDRQRKVYELVRYANEKAISMIKPGILLSEIDKAARTCIEKAGYGSNFTHRLGHGIGLECHEPPDVSQASEIPLEAGMVFSVEPGVYLPGEFGTRIEDLVLVTVDGCEVLNKFSKELRVID
ncbi:MAG: aminopeptidase P family protein [Clostridiales bacterium]|nr:aminopeptidase P family protein [Clostridiales bacterium]